MKKVIFSFLAVLTAVSFATAQKLEDGVKALYYQKYSDAEKILQALVTKDAEEGQNVYWLGQVYLDNTYGETDGVGKALALYQKYAASNNPWIAVGLGEIDYINHNKEAAEQKFQKALDAADKFRGRHKDEEKAALMTAIGRASVYGNRDIGNPAFAIPILQKAMDLDKENPNPALYLGMNFLKLGGDQGGNAFVAFNNAILRDPTFAAAYYRMGRIFHSQNNFEVMDDWYKKGIAADPAYAPIYLDYFDYFKNNDFNKAKEYLDKYVTNSDGGCGVQYFQADYLFRSGNYQESINKGKEMEAGACASYPHLPLLLAVNYHRLGDTAQAVTYAKKFFSTVSPANILPDDYAFGGFIYKDVPEMADSAIKYLKIAYNLDTIQAEKDVYADSIAYALEKANKPIEKYKWLRELYDAKDSTQDGYNTALFNVGYSALQVATNTDSTYFPVADSMFTTYKSKYPDQVYGYMYLVRTKLASKDTAAAIPEMLQYIDFMKKDTAKYKAQLLNQYSFLANYYVNTKGDYPNGLKMFEAISALEPTNAEAKQYADQIRTYLEKHGGESPAASDSSSTGDDASSTQATQSTDSTTSQATDSSTQSTDSTSKAADSTSTGSDSTSTGTDSTNSN